MKKATLFILFVTLCSVPFPYNTVSYGDNQKLTIVVDEACPPYMYGSTKQSKGLYPLLIKAIFDYANIDVEILGYPWKRALMKGKKGETALGGIFKTEKRLKIYDYTDSVYDEKLSIYVKKGNSFGFTSLMDLKGKLLGVNRGWSYGEEFDNIATTGVFRTQEANNNVASFKNLILDRIDCVIAGELSANQIINQENMVDKVEKVTNSEIINKSYVAFAKILHKDDIIKKFNTALSEMRQNGLYEKIIDTFINE